MRAEGTPAEVEVASDIASGSATGGVVSVHCSRGNLAVKGSEEYGEESNCSHAVGYSFANVTVDADGVNTLEFLEASEGVVGIFDLLGSTAFGAVKSDLNGNIKKVRDYHTAHPDKAKTLEQLVISEKDEKKRTATEGLLWLLRYGYLAFTLDALTGWVVIFGGLHFTLA
ncbi:hypothetical protein M407DRAFT_10714, partial [Tulasnella calospora MUT 4182]